MRPNTESPAPRRTRRMSNTAADSEVIPIDSMTRRQLIRRATLIEVVTDLIADVGPGGVQMRDVAQRSGISLATAYRYFRSKEHLLAAALEDWQEQLSRRILTASRTAQPDPLGRVLEFLRRAQRAFHRHPEMTMLMGQLMSSPDPDVGAAIDRMNRTNAELFRHLLDGYPPEEIPNLSFALNAMLTSAVTWLLTGRVPLDEALQRVEWSARALLIRDSCPNCGSPSIQTT